MLPMHADRLRSPDPVATPERPDTDQKDKSMSSKRVVKVVVATLLGIGIAVGSGIPAAIADGGSGHVVAKARDTGWG